MRTKNIIYLIAIVIGLTGCKSYTSNVILKTEANDINWQAEYSKVIVEHPIRVGDKIQFSIFTNQGESIIDPGGNLVAAPNFTDANTANAQKPTYDVLENGMCLFPVIGKLSVVGLKTSQLDSVLSQKFESFYNGVYVISKVINKKIIILGAKGGQLVPYTANMNLLEAIAVYGGIDERSKGYNIRIIRGDLKNPQVTVVNLSTIKDMKSSIITLQPDDIIYIEPVRRPASESIRDNIYIMNVIQVILTTVVILRTLI